MHTEIPPALFAPRQAAAESAEMTEPLALARAVLLQPAGLDENSLANVLGDVMGHAVDYADIYFQLIREESWSLEDGIVKDGAHSIDGGVGVRALSGEKTGFAYSDEIVLPALLEAAHAARAIARSGTAGSVQAWRAQGKEVKQEAAAFIAETAERYGRIWAEAVLLAAVAVARRYLGARGVWLHQPHTGAKLKRIRDRQPPRSLYTDLPRRFCFAATDRAPQLLYDARSQAVHRLRRAPRPVFWRLDLTAEAA